MEELTAAVLRSKYGKIVGRGADIDVPWGWHMIASRMLQKLADLPTAVRSWISVTAIRLDSNGLLEVGIAAVEELIAVGGMDAVKRIVQDARNLAAWSCTRDSREAWIVHPRRGLPRPLCPDCQRQLHVHAEMHCA